MIVRTFIEILREDDKVKISYSHHLPVNQNQNLPKRENTPGQGYYRTVNGAFYRQNLWGKSPFFHVQLNNYSNKFSDLLDIPVFSKKYNIENKKLEKQMKENLVKATYDKIYEERMSC